MARSEAPTNAPHPAASPALPPAAGGSVPTPLRAKRRTADRILDTALGLFNRFGEPNVSTTLIATELGISPGNLYYHYPAKEQLVNGLVIRHDRQLDKLLPAAPQVRHVEDAWLFFHMMFELVWDYRFLHRDLNDLLSRNRQLEQRFQDALKRSTAALGQVLDGLSTSGAMKMDPREAAAVSTSMMVVLTYWLSFEYVRDPRHALEPERASAAMARGAYHVLALLLPYLAPEAREHLHHLAAAYRGA